MNTNTQQTAFGRFFYWLKRKHVPLCNGPICGVRTLNFTVTAIDPDDFLKQQKMVGGKS